MKVHIISRYTGKINVMDLPVTWKQVERWKRGEPVKDVFPHLSPEEKEFLITGMDEEEQKEYYQK